MDNNAISTIYKWHVMSRLACLGEIHFNDGGVMTSGMVQCALHSDDGGGTKHMDKVFI